MTQSTTEKNGMNELPKVGELDAYERHERASAAQVGVAAVEQQLFNEQTDAVEISLWVRGRELRTTTDGATVARIMAILTGLGG